METSFRIEQDALGSIEVPSLALYGAHTARAMVNFPLSGQRLPAVFIRAYAEVKLACARTNAELGYLHSDVARAVETACCEMMRGVHHDHVTVDAFQGGAGTSANMNMNEVLANRAGELLGHAYGSYAVHPLHHLNLHQSTNDTFPTALRVAALHELTRLEQSVTELQETLQLKEQEFNSVLRLARTQLQDAVPMTVGMTFGAWAEAFARDRWRVFKCRERIKTVNLGGTAVGTGLGAPREYIFRVTDELRRITGLKVARAENLVDATQNADSLVEVSAMLKVCAANLFKISSDVRLLGSGPDAGIGELRIAPLQTGSTIMPGKVNPVVPEAVSQAALRVMANDGLAGQVASLGNLELNQFMPLMAQTLLESLHLLNNAVPLLHRSCLETAEPDVERCAFNVRRGGALATVLVPAIGYEKAERIARRARKEGLSVAQAAAGELGLGVEAVEALFLPDRMRQLGFSEDTYAVMDGAGEDT
ncbi:aspartate ammonia-lyase [Pseudodesulfovibrio sediminis]|uniref:Aspartate ammonia-lyase n=1 Tax=Pseudodesulfovibrio sediminis TaxID=2810563 RepID=A0ABN6ESW7_9BACT|nr:aspartate ammonia-lyase [Pseudodesulfovibrio sediminis]BCS88151.1 aspartate ammonia-lyase [Pseudodesulfovibrio sediminis]